MSNSNLFKWTTKTLEAKSCLLLQCTCLSLVIWPTPTASLISLTLLQIKLLVEASINQFSWLHPPASCILDTWWWIGSFSSVDSAHGSQPPPFIARQPLFLKKVRESVLRRSEARSEPFVSHNVLEATHVVMNWESNVQIPGPEAEHGRTKQAPISRWGQDIRLFIGCLHLFAKRRIKGFGLMPASATG